VHLCIYLCWQVVLQVIVSYFGVLEKSGHFGCRLFYSCCAILQDSDFLLKLGKMEVLVLYHCFELSAVVAELLNLSGACVNALCQLFFELDEISILNASRLTEEVFEVFDLPS